MHQFDWWTFFWGGLLIAYGVSLLIKSFFGINIPIFKPLVGVFLIYLGFVMLTGYHPACKIGSKVRQGCYSIFFGQQYIDLSNIDVRGKSKKVYIEVAFGSAHVKLNPQIPMRIKTKAAFSKVKFPDGSSVTMGKQTRFYNEPLDDNYLDIRVRAQFGNIEFNELE